MTTTPLRFGVFFAPFHPVGQNPTLALEYDLERVEALDRLGYDEAWFGEHHSGGYEIIASPEIFIAAAAARTHTGRTSARRRHASWSVVWSFWRTDKGVGGRYAADLRPGVFGPEVAKDAR